MRAGSPALRRGGGPGEPPVPRRTGHESPRRRTTLRIHHAPAHLTDGMSVTGAAVACGWSNPSRFTGAFTGIVGQTPGRRRAGPRSDRA
ncbi:helix-turn-helix domain-containing protein [Streptomyces sp. NPDC057690]|uniref:helix-turn-helix domain-containing protein n=1 Tax=Streptomyces sp. NPDC057690 TaxID=3346214 RepID=UPI00369BFF22